MRNLNSTQTTQATIGVASATTPVARTWTTGLVGAAVGVAIGALLGLAIGTTAMPAPAHGPLSESAGAAGLARQVPVTEQLRQHVLRENAAGSASAGSSSDALRAHLLRESASGSASAGSSSDALRAHLLRENGEK